MDSHRLELEILRRMTPGEKLAKVFELGDMARSLFLAGLRARFPEKPEEEIRRIYLERMKLCHNRSY